MYSRASALLLEVLNKWDLFAPPLCRGAAGHGLPLPGEMSLVGVPTHGGDVHCLSRPERGIPGSALGLGCRSETTCTISLRDRSKRAIRATSWA